jgi:CRP-like cAMP-binding protein
VLKGVEAVDLYPGVEVLFRRNEPPAFLFVSVKGRVAMVS